MAESVQRLMYGAAVAFFAVGLAWTGTSPRAAASPPLRALHESARPGTASAAVPPALQRAINLTLSQNWSQQAELTAADGQQGDEFGLSVALNRDATVALIGAYSHGYEATGAAYVFTESGGTWTQAAELTASDAYPLSGFGWAVGLSADGKTAVISAYLAAKAYIFTESGGTWTQVAEFTDPEGDPLDNYAQSVALSGDGLTALVGSPYGYYNYGAVFAYHDDNGTWSEQSEIYATDGEQGDEFGYKEALSADGTTALVAADGRDSYAGVAYVFNESGGSWSQSAELTPSDGGGFEFLFGYSVALSGDGTIALVGEPYWPYYLTRYGLAYVFTDSGGTWSQTAQLTDPDGEQQYDSFGFGVALSGVGATALVAGGDFSIGGVAHVLSASGGTWTQTAELTASDGMQQDSFGDSMALTADGTTALIGNSQEYNGGNGKAYVFTQAVAEIGFQPASGPPGSTTDLLGTGFTPGETVDLSIGGLTGMVHSNANGRFNVSLRVPNVPPHAYTLTAMGETSGQSAQATFTVTASSPWASPSIPSNWIIGSN